MKSLLKTSLSAGLLAFTLASTAFADVKVVSEVTVKGLPAAAKTPNSDKPVTTTTYFKGDKQRMETGDSVTITETSTGKTITLNPKQKTFIVLTMADIEKMMADNPIAAMIKIDTTTTVTPGKDTKTIAGKEAKLWNYEATMKMGLEGADESQAAFAAFLPTITIKGEQWTTEQINLPVSFSKNMETNFSRMMPMMAKGMKEITQKLATMNGFPLSSMITVTFVVPKEAPPQMTANMPKEIVTTTEVKSIAEENLDDALFTVPADYKEVKPAAPPAPQQ